MFRLEEDQLDVTSIHVTVVEVTQNLKQSTIDVLRYHKCLAGNGWSLVSTSRPKYHQKKCLKGTSSADHKLHRTTHPSNSLRLLVKQSIPPPSPANIGRHIYLHPPLPLSSFWSQWLRYFEICLGDVSVCQGSAGGLLHPWWIHVCQVNEYTFIYSIPFYSTSIYSKHVLKGKL